MGTPSGVDAGSPPEYFTRFIGRVGERGLLGELDAGEAAAQSRRFLTVVGRGGAGKTRLAAEFARALVAGAGSGRPAPDGVVWAELGLLSDASQLPHAVAAAVGLSHGSGADLTRAVTRFLAPRRQLLVLDGCEELTAACCELADSLLADCPLLVILATSRVRLGSPLERVVRLRPLAVGSSVEADPTVPTEAGQLFLDRASVAMAMSRGRDLDPAEVDAVCRRVGGSPLAIELVAAWVGEHSTADLLAALECDPRTAFASGVDRRIRVPAVLDTVWAWLDAHERRVLQGLGSFAGDFTRDAAEWVSGADLAAVDALTRRYLIARIADLDDATRYHMHPLVRRHAARMLDRDPDESGRVRRRHLEYCVNLAECTPGEQADRRELMAPDVQAEYQAALDWGLTSEAVEPVLRLLAALHRQGARWNTTARFQAILEAALARPKNLPTPPTSKARADTLEAAGWAAAECGDQEHAGQRFAEAAAAYLSLDAPSKHAGSLRGQARAHLVHGEMGGATLRLRDSLEVCRRVADLAGAAWSALHLAEVTSTRQEPGAATRQLLIAIKDFQQLGIPLGAYRGYVRLGDNQRVMGRLPEAIDAYTEALALGRQWQFAIDMGDLLAGLAIVAAELGRPVRAATLLGARRAWIDTFGRSSLPGSHGDVVNAERHMPAQIGDEHFVAAVAAGLGLDAAGIRAEAELAVRELASVCRRLTWGITEREVEVLRLVADGLTNADIAGHLGLSLRTVLAHLRSAYGKLGVSARTAAVRQAGSLGLI